ncbi:unnamed protein product [Tenebrio molitor]|nr:unnamed protein product [Tenebrio molitor]
MLFLWTVKIFKCSKAVGSRCFVLRSGLMFTNCFYMWLVRSQHRRKLEMLQGIF